MTFNTFKEVNLWILDPKNQEHIHYDSVNECFLKLVLLEAGLHHHPIEQFIRRYLGLSLIDKAMPMETVEKIWGKEALLNAVDQFKYSEEQMNSATQWLKDRTENPQSTKDYLFKEMLNFEEGVWYCETDQRIIKEMKEIIKECNIYVA